jgi:hypothetical protein
MFELTGAVKMHNNVGVVICMTYTFMYVPVKTNFYVNYIRIIKLVFPTCTFKVHYESCIALIARKLFVWSLH